MRRTRIGTTSLSTTLRGACLTLARGLAVGVLGISFAIALPAAAQANNLFTLDSQADVNGPIVTESSGTGYVAWDRQAPNPATEQDLVLFCKIPRGRTCTSPITLPLPGGSYQEISQPFPVLGSHPGVVYVVGPRYVKNDTLIWTSTDGGEKFSAAKEIPESYSGKTGVGDVLLDPNTPLSAGPTEDYFGIAANNPGLGFSFTANQDVSGSTGFSFKHPGEGGVASSTLGFVTKSVLDPFSHNHIYPEVEAYYNLSNPAEIFFYRYANNGNVDGEESGWEGPIKVTDGYEPRLAGGPDGLFLLSTDLAPGAPLEEQPSVIDVRKYNEETRTFGPPTTIANIPTGAGTLFTSGDIYENPETGALYVAQPVLDSEGNYVMRLWESIDGGQTFHGERNIATIGFAYTEIPRLAVAADGQGWITFKDAGGLEVADLTALPGPAPTPTPTPTPSPTTLTTSQTSGSTTGASISIPAGTIGESDRATISGANASTASGTVDFALYDNSSCSGSPTFAGAAEAVDGTATIADDSSPGLAQGTYYWRASYAGNATNFPSASTCGSEVLTVTPAATSGGSGTSTGTTVTLTITCSGPCTVTITLTIPTASASAARKGKKKPKPLTLATGTFTLPNGGTKKLTLHLTKAGRKAFAAHHGRLSASLLLSEKIDGHTLLSTRTVKITPAKPEHKK